MVLPNSLDAHKGLIAEKVFKRKHFLYVIPPLTQILNFCRSVTTINTCLRERETHAYMPKLHASTLGLGYTETDKLSIQPARLQNQAGRFLPSLDIFSFHHCDHIVSGLGLYSAVLREWSPG